MSDFNVPAVKDGEFSAAANYQGGAITAQLEGNADLRSKPSLEAFLGSLHAEADRLAVPEVQIDFRQLAFMNSSCFKNFVSWIGIVQEAAPEKQYRICFLSNPAMHWQKRSLHALSCFASDLVSVQS